MADDLQVVDIESFEEGREVLRSDSFVPDTDHPRSPLFELTLLLLDGDDHRARRKAELQLFRRSVITGVHRDALVPAIGQAIRSCFAEGARAGDSVVIDLVPVLRIMTYRMAATISGIDVDDDAESIHDLIKLQDRIVAGGSVTYGSTDNDERLGDGLAARDEFRTRFFDPSWERRRRLIEQQTPAGAPTDVDILSLLIAESPACDYPTMVAETALYFSASVGNTARTVPHALDDLLSWIEVHPQDAGRTADPEFLQQAASETLRLHPASPNIWRRAARTTELSTGRVITEGTLVRMDVTAANHDPNLYGGDAAVFNPFRHLPADHRWGLTFGDGSHKCIGKSVVTGGPSIDDGRSDGLISSILYELFRYSVRRAPARSPVRHADPYADYHDSYPVELVAPAAPLDVNPTVPDWPPLPTGWDKQ